MGVAVTLAGSTRTERSVNTLTRKVDEHSLGKTRGQDVAVCGVNDDKGPENTNQEEEGGLPGVDMCLPFPRCYLSRKIRCGSGCTFARRKEVQL